MSDSDDDSTVDDNSLSEDDDSTVDDDSFNDDDSYDDDDSTVNDNENYDLDHDNFLRTTILVFLTTTIHMMASQTMTTRTMTIHTTTTAPRTRNLSAKMATKYLYLLEEITA